MAMIQQSEAQPSKRAAEACGLCCGGKLFPMLDPWKAKKGLQDNPKKDVLQREFLTFDVPCPECQSEAFWAYLENREFKEGYPLGAPAETIVVRTIAAGLMVSMPVVLGPTVSVIGR